MLLLEVLAADGGIPKVSERSHRSFMADEEGVAAVDDAGVVVFERWFSC